MDTSASNTTCRSAETPAVGDTPARRLAADISCAWLSQTQEIPCLLIPLWLWYTAPQALAMPNKALLVMFVAHYAHR